MTSGNMADAGEVSTGTETAWDLPSCIYHVVRSDSMLQKAKRNVELLVSILFATFFAVTFLNAKKWINAMTMGKYEIGPYAFPRAVCVVAFVLMAAIITKQIRMLRVGDLPIYDTNEEKPTYFTMLGLVALCMGFVWAMPTVGFIVASLVLLPVLLVLVGVRKPLSIVLFTVGVFVVTFIFFCLLLKLQLPRGKGIFKAFSLLFY